MTSDVGLVRRHASRQRFTLAQGQDQFNLIPRLHLHADRQDRGESASCATGTVTPCRRDAGRAKGLACQVRLAGDQADVRPVPPHADGQTCLVPSRFNSCSGRSSSRAWVNTGLTARFTVLSEWGLRQCRTLPGETAAVPEWAKSRCTRSTRDMQTWLSASLPVLLWHCIWGSAIWCRRRPWRSHSWCVCDPQPNLQAT
jgi:hypothetical protein